MKAPNNIFEDLINRLTYQYTILNSNIDTDSRMTSNPDLTPLWITGMFRSGTSITTNLIHQMGMDIGPQQDLLKAKGGRANLNPDGFFENFLMMELSLHIFSKLNSWGDQPPLIEQVNSFDLNTIDYREFVYDSIVNFHDDRLSNKNKSRILQKYYPSNLNQYFNKCFNKHFAIKNPHFLLLYPILDKYWPNSKYLVVFRNPYETIESAKKVSPRVNLELYYQYYSRIIHHSNAIFLDYNQLILTPERSLEALSEHLNLTLNLKKLMPFFKSPSNQISTIDGLPDHISVLYKSLQEKAINPQ